MSYCKLQAALREPCPRHHHASLAQSGCGQSLKSSLQLQTRSSHRSHVQGSHLCQGELRARIEAVRAQLAEEDPPEEHSEADSDDSSDDEDHPKARITAEADINVRTMRKLVAIYAEHTQAVIARMAPKYILQCMAASLAEDFRVNGLAFVRGLPMAEGALDSGQESTAGDRCV